MDDGNTSFFEYLIPPKPSTWKWKGHAEVITWTSGGTIVFRSELGLVLRSSQLERLPALSDMILVLAACRDSWKQVSEFACEGLDSTTGNDLLDALSRVSSLPPRLRNPIEAKTGLIDFLFEQYPASKLTQETGAICDVLERPAHAFVNGLRSVSAAYRGQNANTRRLIEALKSLDKETLQLRQATGLDQLVWPAAAEFKTAHESRALVSKLHEEDVEFHGLAKLARALMAVVHLPRAIADPEDLPMGGFSDITNRGSVDRLLVSELAHDELTLSVRLALNEALYLRRESPPKTPSQSRSILIDVGIRMWGVPRVFAASVALALAATADNHVTVSAFRAAKDRLAPVDLATRQGLVKLLAALEVDAHPGDSLPQFFAESVINDSHVDYVIVTSADTADNAEFSQLLRRYDVASLYLATVNRNGQFRLIHQAAHGRKVVCEATLSLDDILRQEPPRSRLPLLDKELDTEEEIPAIFHLDRFPLRIPDGGLNARQSWFVHNVGVFEISRRGRLLLWDYPDHGPLQLLASIRSKAGVCWNDPVRRSGNVCVVLGDQSHRQKTLLSYNLRTRKPTWIRLVDEPDENMIAGYNGMLYSVGTCTVRFLSQTDGQCLGEIDIPSAVANEPVCGRFFRDRGKGGWYALTFDGDAGRFERVVDHETQERVKLIGLYDWFIHEGPLGVTKDCQFFLPEEKECRTTIENQWGKFAIEEINHKRKTIFICREMKDKRESNLIDACTGRLANDARNLQGMHWMMNGDRYDWKCFRVLPTKVHGKFFGVLADQEIGILLVTRKRRCWRIHLKDGKIWMSHIDAVPTKFSSEVRPFRHQHAYSNPGCTLQYAQWEDEWSRAWLDSRDLLHLRSANSRIPEISFVLSEGRMSGWCSDGRVWGAPFFIGNQASADDAEVYNEVIQPFIEQLP